MSDLISITIDEPVIIQDGYVRINLPQYGLKINQRVKQVRYTGVSDADKLKIVNDYHKEILTQLMTMPDTIEFTGFQIRYWIRVGRELKKDRRIYRDANWIRPISELFRKGIIYEVGRKGNSLVYRVNKKKAEIALTSGSFNE